MDLTLKGSAYRIAKAGLDAAREIRQSILRSVAVAQVEDPRAELARSGRRFGGGLGIIANGIAPVQAIPTTTATIALVNMEDPGGLVIHPNRVGFFLGSGTPAAGATLLMCVSRMKVASPPTAMATGWGIGSLSGSSQSSKAFWATAVTIAAGSVWMPILSTAQLAAANVGQGDNYVDLEGQFAVPPGYALCFAILSGAGTTPLYGIGLTTSEVESDLE